jgi:PAS domain S-box-containing protein
MTHPAGPGRYLLAYLALQLTGCLVFFVGPFETARTVGLVAVPLVAGVAIVLGARRQRPARAPAWFVLAAGVVLSAVAWGWMGLVAPGVDGLDSSGLDGHAFFVLGYLVSAVGVIALVGLRRRADRVALLDAAMLSIGLGLLAWVLVDPSRTSTEASGGVRVALLTYLIVDVLLLSIVARLLFAGLRSPGVWLMAGWAATQAAGDAGYVLQVLRGSFEDDSLLFALWLAGYVAVGAAALQRSPGDREPTGRWQRAFGPAVIVAAVLPLPVLLLGRALRGSSEDLVLIAIGSVVMTVLAVVRGLVATESPTSAARASVRWSATRFVAGFLALALLPLSGLAYLAMHESETAMRAEVRDRMEVTASVSAEYIGEQLNSLKTLVSSYATRPILINAMQRPGGPDLTDVNGQLQALQQAHPDLIAAWMLDPQGDLLAMDPVAPSVMGQNFAHRNYFQRARYTNSAYVSQAYIRATPPHVRLIGVSRTVRDADGRVLGVLAVGYRLDGIRAFADRLADVQGVRMTVTDQAGHLLGGVGSERPGLPTVEDARVDAALAGRSSTVEGPGESGSSVSSYRAVEGFGWAVVAEISDDVAFAGQRRQSSRVIAAAVLLGQILLAGLVLAERAHRRRRQLDASLAEREEHLRGVLQAAGDAFVSVDGDGRVTAWNSAATTVFGYGPEDAMGADLADLVIPPETREAHRAGIARVVSGGESRLLGQRVEVEARHADGHHFRAELTLWAGSRAGAPSFNAFVRDVTERTRQQEEVADARDAALAASRLKSEFVANMSHEIRTPMNGVLGMTSLLLDTPLDPVQRDYADTIGSSAEALLTVIDDILNFSKIEAGQLDIESIDFELRPLVENVASLLGPAAHGRGVELVVLVDPRIPAAVCGDPHRLRQVLTNMVGNAVKYTERGEVVVTVEPGYVDPSHIRFAVRDTGIGISPAQQSRLFEAFQQADASTTRRYGGTGLGLTISRQLVELMGGSLGVRSELGLGSTFFFELPLPVGESRPAVSPAPSDLAGTRVLVVDDNATNRKVLQQLLTSWSLLPTCVADGPTALAELRRGVAVHDPFGLVLLDMIMPGMSGLEVVLQVRSDPDLAHTPVVMLTSSSDAGERAAAEAAGIGGYLAKPVRELPLHECLTELLAVRPPQSPAADVLAAAGQILGRVLVAEDNVVNQRVAIGMLTSLGYAADVAGDGRQAVEMVARTRYDLVLMDCQMPVMDGFAAAREIRASGPEGEVPIVALTASALEADRERCFAAGMNDFLSKPLRRDALASALADWMPTGGAVENQPDTGAPQRAAEDDVLDPELVDELLELGPEFLSGVVSRFTESGSARIDAIEAALVAGDTGEVARVAHSLRGTSATLAAHRLSGLAAEAETIAAGDGVVPAGLVDDLRREHGLAVIALTAAVASAAGSSTPDATPTGRG